MVEGKGMAGLVVLIMVISPLSDKGKRLGAHSAHRWAKRSGALGAERSVELCEWAVVRRWERRGGNELEVSFSAGRA